MSCPICKKPVVQKYRPFCSNRCADIDLGKWMTGDYAVASQSEDDLDALDAALTKAKTGAQTDAEIPPKDQLH